MLPAPNNASTKDASIQNKAVQDTAQEGMQEIRLFGAPIKSLPKDLYIPPDFFAIWLEQFCGPLDFLLYLVKKNNLDIANIDILPIIEQYLEYIDQLDGSFALNDFDLAGDYLLMAGTLINIKSQMLLPVSKVVQNEDSPTKKLIQKLEGYAQIKQAAQNIDNILRLERDVFLSLRAFCPDNAPQQVHYYSADILTKNLIAMQQKENYQLHHIKSDTITLSSRMNAIKKALQSGKKRFFELLDYSQGRTGIVLSFMAILEFAKQEKLTFSTQKADGHMQSYDFIDFDHQNFYITWHTTTYTT